MDWDVGPANQDPAVCDGLGINFPELCPSHNFSPTTRLTLRVARLRKNVI